MPKNRIEDIKITRKMGVNFINSLLNIANHEWPRVIYCFLLKFFVDSGKVIGHTILLSMVAARLGIENLPVVLVISGVLVMISTTFFSRILYKIEKQNLILVLATLAMILLLASRFVLGDAGEAVTDMNTYIFFSFYLIAEAVLFIQLEIILAIHIEGYFTSLESIRTFPVIESAQVWAGIVGGSLITFLHLYTPNYIYLWAIFLLLVIPTVMIYRSYSRDVLSMKPKKVKTKSTKIITELKNNIRILKMYPFLKTMTIIVFLYFAIFKILEFKYTKAFYQTSGGEESLTHGLGVYVLVFSSIALFIQLLMSSRIIKKIGIVNSMILNPLLSLVGFFLMMFYPTGGFVIGSKFIFDTTGVIYKNAYLSSFYAIVHQAREKIKALIEGWVTPIGIIFGTVLTMLVQYLEGFYGDLVLRILLVVFATYIMVMLLRQKKNYTNTVVNNLNSANVHERYNAIEILGEKGHVNNTVILNKRLSNWINNKKVIREKIKIIETLGRLKDESTIPIILDCFEDSSQKVRMAAVEALVHFKTLGKRFYTQTFAKYRIISALKNLFESSNSKRIKSAVVKVFANLDQLEVVPFLLDILKSASSEIKADCIYVIGRFHDPNIAYYLKPYLSDKDPKVKANTIIALWQFKDMRLDLIFALTSMLEDNENKGVLLSGIYATGELKAIQEEKKLFELLKSEDTDIHMNAAIALFKIGNKSTHPHILKLLFSDDRSVADKILSMLKGVEEELKEYLWTSVAHEVSLRANQILKKYEYDDEKLSKEELDLLIWYYKLIDEDTEVLKLEGLKDRQKY